MHKCAFFLKNFYVTISRATFETNREVKATRGDLIIEAYKEDTGAFTM